MNGFLFFPGTSRTLWPSSDQSRPVSSTIHLMMLLRTGYRFRSCHAAANATVRKARARRLHLLVDHKAKMAAQYPQGYIELWVLPKLTIILMKFHACQKIQYNIGKNDKCIVSP